MICFGAFYLNFNTLSIQDVGALRILTLVLELGETGCCLATLALCGSPWSGQVKDKDTVLSPHRAETKRHYLMNAFTSEVRN